MSGIDKIIEQINVDSENEVNSIISKAEADAKQILNKADEKLKAEINSLVQQSESECKNVIERAESTGNLIKKQALLRAKQQIINETVSMAHTKLLNLGNEEYFNLIIQMIEKYSTDEKGEILFNQNDLNRMPKLFSLKITKASKGSLKLSGKPVNIDGGFILSYGGVEENCSFKALFEGNSEMLQDKVNSLLFS